MSFFSDTRETSARYGTPITEFQELCKRYEVSVGTPEDFFRLGPKLAYDEKFRAEFCRLTKSVAQRAEGRLTLTQILTIIAIAMGGEGIGTVGTAGAVPVSLVVVFLAGVGGWSEEEKEAEGKTDALEPVLQAETVQPVMQVESAGLHSALSEEEEQEALELERRLSAEPNHSLDEVTASLFGGPALVKEALSRLEINTLELKLHLDSIDSRMDRIEPHLDDLSSRFATEQPRTSIKTQAAKMQPDWEELPPVRYAQTEIRLMETPTDAPLFKASATAPSTPMAVIAAATPVSQLAAASPLPSGRPQAPEVRKLHRLVATLGLLLLVMGIALAGVLYVSHGSFVKAEVGDVLNATAGDAAAKTLAAPDIARQPVVKAPMHTPAPVVSASHAPQQKEPDRSAENESHRQKVGRDLVVISGQGDVARKINIDKDKGEERPPDVPLIHLADALPHAFVAKPTAEPGATSSEASPHATPSLTATNAVTTAVKPNEGKIFVPANTLVRNAIASPPPVYPSMARLQRVEGDVLLEALVDQAGRIEKVNVVNGPEPLRNAAIDALRNWRFRPYTVDGHPVPIRTLVDFHFRMTQ